MLVGRGVASLVGRTSVVVVVAGVVAVAIAVPRVVAAIVVTRVVTRVVALASIVVAVGNLPLGDLFFLPL